MDCKIHRSRNKSIEKRIHSDIGMRKTSYLSRKKDSKSSGYNLKKGHTKKQREKDLQQLHLFKNTHRKKWYAIIPSECLSVAFGGKKTCKLVIAKLQELCDLAIKS